MGRLFVPASVPDRVALSGGQHWPLGHPKAARSGVDGREHGAMLADSGTMNYCS
jgi:hypothetical protein